MSLAAEETQKAVAERACAVVTLLHETAGDNSAVRRFRREPVLAWTLERLSRSRLLGDVSILCWEEQLEAVEPIAQAAGAYVLAKGPMLHVPQLEAINASRRWADGWRGGLLGTCAFDAGFYAPWTLELLQRIDADAAVLVDASAALIDAEAVDALIAHARTHPHNELCFLPTAPGLGAALVHLAAVERLAKTKGHAGRRLHYWPDLPGKDPIALDSCVPAPAVAARTPLRYTVSSARQAERLETTTVTLNGQLMSSDAEEIVSRVAGHPWTDALPRDLTLELASARSTRALFRAGTHHAITREPLTPERARRIFRQFSALDDTRLTLAGAGDPLLAPAVFEIIAAASDAGIRAVHVETDFVGVPASAVERLAQAPVDIVSVHLPASTAAVYEQIMGVAAIETVIENIRIFLAERARRGRGTPLLAPTFTKCRQNLGEMEGWYDAWLKALGSAVIVGPTDCAGRIPHQGVAAMAPPKRRACARLESRMTILSDGRIVACEEDALGEKPLGHVDTDEIAAVWLGQLASLRQAHERGEWGAHPLCAACSEWHRP